MFTVYDKTGENIRCTTGKLEYNGTFMGECSVTIDIISPTPIDFHIGDYLVYRGETFEINYDPSVIKTARVNTVGDAFKYEKIKFNSYSDELARVDFLDFVPNDNNVHFTALPTFSFFCADVTDLAKRIQANLDRVYTGSKKWTVSVHPEFVGKKDVNISVSDIKVWDALGLANSDFEANFIIRGRTITIGTAGIAVGNMFAYGKNNGLFEIERNAESDQAIITRLRAYGSEKNLPPRYYNKLSQSLPNNMAVTHLMLPGFPLSTQDPHIDSSNISELGVREGTVFFDGSNGNEEIYPSIEGMTYGGHNIDEVQSAEQTTDDGTWEVPEGETSVNIPNFTITLYNLGFDIRDYLIEGQNPVITMKSGLCAGREFEIVNVSQNEQTGYYTLECRRTEDSSLGLVFPYKDYNVQAGDKFVLLYISMPTEYITAASQRLYNAAVAYLAKCDYVRYSYSPKVDNIFLQRQHDSAIANSGTSIHDTIKEGDLLLFSDTDLGISGSIIIDQLTIKEGDELIPQYEITLRNDKTVGTIQRLQQQIDSIINGSTSVGGYNAQQIQSIIRAYGDTRYLRKDIDDVARGLIDSLKGFQVGADFVSGLFGEGGIFRKEADGTTYIETDRLYVRLKAYFDEIEVKKYEHSGGNRIASKVGNKTVKVVKYDSNGDPIDDDDETTTVSFYRCYIKLSETDADGNTTTTSNDWKEGDLARSQEFNIGNNGSEVTVHGYWCEVIGVGATADDDGLGYIDLSAENCMSGSNIPQPQDDIIQLGSLTNSDRQGAIIEYSTGSNAPAYQIYQGIGSDSANPFSLNGKNYITIGYNGSTGKAEIIDYGDAYFGDRPSYDGQGHDLRRSYLEYDSTTGQMTIKADLKITAPVTNTETDLVDWIYGDFKNIEQLTQLLNSVELDFGAIEWREGELANNADLNAMIQGGDTTASSLKTTMTSNFSLLQSAYQSLATAINNVKNAGTVSDQTLSTIQGLYNTYKARKLTTETSVSSVSDYLLHYNYQGISDLDYLKQALQEDTQVTGGLIQSSLLSLGYHEASTNVYKTMAGLNGIYDSTKIGNGIAAWYGGAMTDIEGKVTRVTSPSGNPSAKNYYEYDSTNNIYVPSKDTTVTSGKTYYKRDWDSLSDSQKKNTIDYAKSLFRMDGTGYVASGNISWDSLGRVTLKNLYTDTGKSIDQLLSLFSIGGTIPTNAYITPAYPFNSLSVLVDGSRVDVIEALQKLQQLFVAHYKEVNGVLTNELESIEATAPLWSQGEVSALGYDGSGGGGGGGVTVYDGLDSTNPNIALSANQGRVLKGLIDNKDLSAYALKSELATVATSGSYNDLSNKPTIPAAQIQSDWNQTTTSAKDYIKNKPTKLSQFTNDSNYATQTWVNNKGYATTSAMNTALSNYLPLVGGTMSNTNLVTNLNADLLDGYEATDISRLGWVTTQNASTSVCSWFEVANPSTNGTLFSYEIITKRSTSTHPTIEHYRLDVFRYSNTQLSISLTNIGINFISGNIHKVCAAISTDGKVYVQHGSTAATSQRMYIRPILNAGSVSDTPVGSDAYAVASGFTAVGIVEITGYLKVDGTSVSYTGDTRILTPTEEAYKLKNARTLWGQSFDGSANISGDMSGVGTLTASGLITANGNIKTASYIEIGNYRIVADTDNTALKVVHKNGTTSVNFYATGENSALGVNTSGGGGGGDGASLEAVWTSLGSSTGTYGTSQINASHLTTALNGYATQTWVNQQGFLTSYTETDPVFTASAAHGITSSDITSWNNKVSNVQANWNATSGLAVILNKPTLATVATSGKYSDLTGKPTNVSSFTNDANYVTSSSLATTLASYATTSAMNTALSGYLPLTGGTLSGNLSVERTGTTTAKVTALNTNGSVSIYQGTGNNRGLYDDSNSKWIVGTNGTNSFLMEGNVGIGTTSPSYKLHVDGTAYASSAFDVATGTTTDLLGYKVGGGTVVRGTSTSVIISPPSSSGTINFYPKGSGDTTGRSTIDNDGKFGINTNTPSYQLHVNGYAYATRNYINGENYLGGNSTQLFAYIGTANPLVMGETYIRRGTSDTSVTLGTSSYPWANLYSVLGNFSGQITSSVATGTSPLSIASTTLVDNLNADLLDGYHATEVSRLGWVGVSNATGSSDQCKWYEVNVPTSSGSIYVYDIIAYRNAYPFVAYYRLAVYRYNANVVSVSLINHGFSHKNANQTRVCVAIDANQKVYIQSGSRTATNYLRIRPYYNAGSINTTAVGEAEFGTANGFTALKMVTDSGYFRVDTSAATQSTAYDGDPMIRTSVRIGNAYLWWDDTNNCLRITGVNSNGVPTSSVVVNVNVSGEVTALKTS